MRRINRARWRFLTLVHSRLRRDHQVRLPYPLTAAKRALAALTHAIVSRVSPPMRWAFDLDAAAMAPAEPAALRRQGS
jgi:hypothetical protein